MEDWHPVSLALHDGTPVFLWVKDEPPTYQAAVFGTDDTRGVSYPTPTSTL
ncbi:hypothetical protein MAE02_65090 [Microvirga aerophila]|uniref:Uncharacterized protein n=1 Tax=Microvirga aerophila TaxID=670291 RepID=A0A512C3N3_9HYPH|nr:hypothetical protein MAE02_65090 [Microvirga aerophila]